jgi:hypothetical protein
MPDIGRLFCAIGMHDPYGHWISGRPIAQQCSRCERWDPGRHRDILLRRGEKLQGPSWWVAIVGVALCAYPVWIMLF